MNKALTDTKYFVDRVDAAEQLFDALPTNYFDSNDTVVLALSEGGTIIADTVAQRLKCDMDILLSESILAPNNKELPIARVSETQQIVVHRALVDSFGIDDDYIYQEAKRVYDKDILSYLYKYRDGTHMRFIKGKSVILVDECVETDLTVLVAIKTAISLGARSIYIATPIMDGSAYDSLMRVGDGLFCPHQIRNYISVEYYYDSLEKPDLEDIKRILKKYE